MLLIFEYCITTQGQPYTAVAVLLDGPSAAHLNDRDTDDSACWY